MWNRNLLYRIFRVAIILWMILACVYFLFRGMVLDFVIKKVSVKLKHEYNLDLFVTESGITGLSTVYLYDLSLRQEGRSLLFRADTLIIRPGLRSLMLGEIRIKSFEMSNAGMYLICDSGVCNYSRQMKTIAGERKDSGRPEINLAEFLNTILRRAFNMAPQSADIRNFQLEILNDTIHEKLRIPVYVSSSKRMDGEFEDVLNGYKWNLTGSFSQKLETFDITVYPLSQVNGPLPILRSFFGVNCVFDTLHAALNDLHYGHGKLDLSGHFSSSDLKIYNKRISSDTVRFVKLQIDARMLVEKDRITCDSSSAFRLNSIRIHPYIQVKRGNAMQLALSLRMPPTEATDFFYSLPEGMFEVVRDVEADGELEFSLDFNLDMARPDSLLFNAELRKHKFRITKYGSDNLLKLNGPFKHSVYENDRLYRVFEVGPDNPSFTPIDSVSPYFQSAVLTSEDGNFYFHQGFNEEAFRQSIATNIKAGRFQRGGSTISMQLVKNVFLTRKKTIARKVEEAMIVWLIENNRLVSKKRMFEVYLNIIELGPGIYGIGEASPFYFDKRPSELTLAESIFLAHLLPQPKWFRYSFDEAGKLKPHLEGYYRIVSGFMLQKNLITQSVFDSLQAEVVLKGPAREIVVKTDSVTILETEAEKFNQ